MLIEKSTFPLGPCEQDKSSMVRKKGTEKQGEPFQEDSRRDGSVRTLRLGPWHPEGQPTCRAKPLGIDTTPYMINSAATYNKCCTVYMTYFKIEETQHPCFSYVPPPLKHLSFGPHCGRAPEQTTTISATCTSSNCIPFPISFGPVLERMITFNLAICMPSNSFTLVGQNLQTTRTHQQVSSVCAGNHPAIYCTFSSPQQTFN